MKSSDRIQIKWDYFNIQTAVRRNALMNCFSRTIDKPAQKIFRKKDLSIHWLSIVLVSLKVYLHRLFLGNNEKPKCPEKMQCLKKHSFIPIKWVDDHSCTLINCFICCCNRRLCSIPRKVTSLETKADLIIVIKLWGKVQVLVPVGNEIKNQTFSNIVRLIF